MNNLKPNKSQTISPKESLIRFSGIQQIYHFNETELASNRLHCNLLLQLRKLEHNANLVEAMEHFLFWHKNRQDPII